MKKNDFLRAFSYEWPLYLILPLIGGLTISYLMTLRHAPAPYEKLNVFVSSSSIESEKLCSRMEEEFKGDGLKSMSTTQANPSDALFAQKLSVVGYEGADLFILNESALKNLKPSDSMLPFSDSFKAQEVTLTAPTYYVYDGTAYGVLLKKKGADSFLSSYIGFLDEDYYLTVNVKSKNIGTFGLYDNAQYDLGLKAFRYFLGEQK